MAKSLVIVESPAKAKTIKKYLGSGFSVKASVGHVKDLPKSKMAVDVENDFTPEYVPIRGKAKVISEIRKASEDAERVYLGSDPDREGEAIAWHIADEIREVCPDIKRVLFNEITKAGVTHAIQNPVELDLAKYESQQARRILDRLVGYEISPILWKKVRRGLSAGRVQSVAVRLVVDRERAIRAFVPVEYWSIIVEVKTDRGETIELRLVSVGEQKPDLKSQADAEAVAQRLTKNAPYKVTRVTRKQRRRKPLPPFITSKLQQEASRQLRFSPKRTMALAQRLYEGVELADEGAVGLITYMRTDSTRIAAEAVDAVRKHIRKTYGKEYLPDEPVVYPSRKAAQDAHEAIRPADLRFDPETVRKLLAGKAKDKETAKTREAEEIVALYTLIWNRFVACQMNPAIYDQTVVDVVVADCTLRATGQVLRFDGYRAVYRESEEEPGTKDKDAEKEDKEGEAVEREGERTLPDVQEGDGLALCKVQPNQHFTQPPPRFSEASLVKELEELGVGRPSTYANILSTVQDREYVEKREGRLYPTELGELVNDLLCHSFPSIVNVEFTANLEEQLDQVEEGAVNWVKLLRGFYDGFSDTVAKAKVEMRDVRKEETPTEHVCEKCGAQMVIKWGKNGKFLACSGYPNCKNTKEFRLADDGTVEIVQAEVVSGESCEKCGAPMTVKRGRFGAFLACTRYPECKTTKAISLGVSCPKEGCDGFLAEKRSRRGKSFYGCSNYSKTACDWVAWDMPVPTPCPQCGAKLLLKKQTRAGTRLYCHDKKCGFAAAEGELSAPAPEAPAAASAKNGEGHSESAVVTSPATSVATPAHAG